MASIVTYSDGLRRIDFAWAPDQPRRAVRLGRANAKQAEAFKAKIATIIADKLQRRPHDAEVAQWLGELPEHLLRRLRAVGLADGVGTSVAPPAALLGTFLSTYITKRIDVKPGTEITYRNVERNLVAYFGADKPLADILEGNAEDFRLHLIGENLADNTVRRRVAIARQMLRKAVKDGLIARNPFGELRGLHVRGNPKRRHYIARDDAQRVLDACPDAQWRLLFALARFGGVRVPSEALGLTWADVDWERSRVTVRCVKTEHHDGHGVRVIPLFAPLREPLLQCFEQAEPGAEFCITRYRDATQNLRTQLERIIKRAGLEPWPKLWVNLRASRATELAARFPAHVVASWLGHSVAIAEEHYLQVRDEDYARAVGLGEEAQQKAQQSAAVCEGPAVPPEPTGSAQVAENTGNVACGPLCASAVGDGGWAARDSNP